MDDRKKWQKNTVKYMRERLMYKSRYEMFNGREEKLVTIFGSSQVGKTTLILCLLGISQEAQKKVASILRAGIPKGNPATSTAIMYRSVDSEQFGLGYVENQDSVIDNIQFYEDDEFSKKIREIRTDVENNKGNMNILRIYIPRKYFEKNMEEYINIGILDLPGYGSRIEEERHHVNALIRKYLPISTVTIIACKGNEIQSLKEDIELPTNINWRTLPHKFMIVITNAYALGTEKQFFEQKFSERKQSFRDYIYHTYKESMENILETFSGGDWEVFPIDIGESFECLYEEINDLEDKKELKSTSDSILEDIRKSIQRREGNELKSIIQGLNSFSENWSERRIKELQEELEDCKNEIDIFEKELSINKNEIEKLKEYRDILEEKHRLYGSLNRISIEYIYEAYVKDVNEVIELKSKNGKLKDQNKEVLSLLKNKLIEFIEHEMKILEQSGIEKDNMLTPEMLYSNIESELQVIGEIEKIFYPQSMISWFKQVEVSKCLEKIDKCFYSYRIKLQGYLQLILEKQIKKIEQDEINYILCIENLKERKKRIQKIENDISSNNEIIKKLQKEIESVRQYREEDCKILNDYSEIAQQQFKKQKKELMNSFQRKNISVSEKVQLLFFMGLLEKDYKNIMGMGNF